MKKIIIPFALILLNFCHAQNQEIQHTIETFFEGFHQKDSLKMKSVCDGKMILHSVSEGKKGTKLKTVTPSEMYESIATIPREMQFQEKILSYNIQTDGAMAHVWTPYEFYINGELSHSGVNAFTLFKENEVWKIIYLIDTRRK